MSLQYNNILVAYNDDVCTLTINRPEALNAINQDVMENLRLFFSKDYTQLEGLSGVVITGAGDKAFVAGADISEFSELNAERGSALSRKGHDVFNTIERFHLPVIAVIDGYSLGGGNELAMACHMRIATPKSKFGQPEVNLGMIPGYGGTQRLIQLIGRSVATELLLTGSMIDAPRAYQLGLVNYILPKEEAIEKANKIISKIGTKGPIAIAKTIETINAQFEKDTNGFETEIHYFGYCLETEDAKEGAKAFLEKRKAIFKGN